MKLGTNGNLSVGLNYEEQARFNGSFDLNYRNGKFNVYGNYGNNVGKSENKGYIFRPDDGIEQNFDFLSDDTSNLLKAGLDFYLNDKNTLSFYTTQNFYDGKFDASTVILYNEDPEQNQTQLFNQESNNLASTYNFDYKLAVNAFESIDPALKTKNKANQDIVFKIEQKLQNNPNKSKVLIGDKAPDFSAPNPDGKDIRLSEIQGKVTIIDFWASWCKPCRVENPNLVNLYNTYQSKGLEIISVSLDQKTQKEAWITAIEKDQLSWFNVSNLKSWQDPIARTYGVNSIPATFIIDENGTVISEGLRGAALVAKIKALLD